MKTSHDTTRQFLTVWTEPTELNVVEVFPRGAGVVDLTESVNVGIAPALDLVDATEVERIVEDDF